MAVVVKRGGQTVGRIDQSGDFAGYLPRAEGLDVRVVVSVTKGNSEIRIHFDEDEFQILAEQMVEANPKAAVRAFGAALSEIDFEN